MARLLINSRLWILVLAMVGLSFQRQVWADDNAVTRINARTQDSERARNFDPVIITGRQIAAFNGASVDDLFVYVYRDDVWKQVPAQIDEVDQFGSYVAPEDDILDANDELVFMAQDLGIELPDDGPPVASESSGVLWYEIHVRSSQNGSDVGWAYVLHSRDTESVVENMDYVRFDAETQRIVTNNYVLGFAGIRPWIDHLSLGDSAIDIVDRTKLRVFCELPIVCPINETLQQPPRGGLVKDGPVRVIDRGGELLAYKNLVVWTRELSKPAEISGDVQLSMDFNNAAVGGTFYNDVVPDGTTIDGVPDTVPQTPYSPWWQVSTDQGAIVVAMDAHTLGGAHEYHYDQCYTNKNSGQTNLHQLSLAPFVNILAQPDLIGVRPASKRYSASPTSVNAHQRKEGFQHIQHRFVQRWVDSQAKSKT